MFEVSGGMFVLSVQLLALQTLLWNPKQYAEKLKDSKVAQKFKDEPSQQQMREFLFSHIVHDNAERETKRTKPISLIVVPDPEKTRQQITNRTTKSISKPQAFVITTNNLL